ncbi:hypothetical protein M2323_000815 [Rhodoblastus acidophilus]|uniref:cell division protein FtsL n=1 Tax=Rhodoblastus acidophilus TaxID=1074 RepID=UPI00222510CB|nr:hypothetical protein [Rhodoblastus acidophilus]MCW2283038.1 hypothetical protein [Rhodoblastus acidophilus]MCW2331911.1 hypothetical protein [Rhodoblastus acidophilus]
MFRILNILAVLVLVGSAVYAYEIKYAALYQAEQLAKAKRDLARETDRVTMLKAEWAQLDSPGRMETLAGKYLGGQKLQLNQIVLASAVPEKAARGDEIAAKLADLGLAAPTKTPSGDGGGASSPVKPAASPAKGSANPAKPGASSAKPSANAAKPAAKPAASAPKPPSSAPAPAASAAKPAKAVKAER